MQNRMHDGRGRVSCCPLDGESRLPRNVLPFGMRILRLVFLNYAAINAKFRSLHRSTAGLRTWHDADQASVSRLRHSASPGRALSAIAPSRASAQRSGLLITWAMPASTGIRTLIGSSRVPGSPTSAESTGAGSDPRYLAPTGRFRKRGCPREREAPSRCRRATW